jgi:hypothetical protein
LCSLEEYFQIHGSPRNDIGVVRSASRKRTGEGRAYFERYDLELFWLFAEYSPNRVIFLGLLMFLMKLVSENGMPSARSLLSLGEAVQVIFIGLAAVTFGACSGFDDEDVTLGGGGL